MAYDYLDDDIGFKLLENGDYPNPDEHLSQRPYLFKRSEIENAIKTRPPQTLYLRNVKRMEDYIIRFQSTTNLGTFLSLFPDRMYDEQVTADYYIIR